MAAGDYRIGLDGKFYYGTAGSQASTEADNVRNVNLNLTARTAEAVRRGKDWVAKKAVVLEAEITFEVYDIEADAFLSAIKNAYIGKSKIALYPTDASSGEGLDCDCYITSFGRNENNEDFIVYSVTAVPVDEQRDPSWT